MPARPRRRRTAPASSEPSRTRPPLTIHRLDAASREAVVACVALVYPRDNLIARALELSIADYRPLAERVVDAALEANMGLVVRGRGQAVVGFHFSLDLYDQLQVVDAMAHHVDGRLRAWGELLRRLFGAYVDAFGRPSRHGEVLYLNIMALDEAARGSGLMPALQHRAVLEFGVKRGYGAIVGIATHPETLALARGLSPDWSAEVAYTDLPDVRLHALRGAAQIVRYQVPRATVERASVTR